MLTKKLYEGNKQSKIEELSKFENVTKYYHFIVRIYSSTIS